MKEEASAFLGGSGKPKVKVYLEQYLKIQRCPYCKMHTPNLLSNGTIMTTSANGTYQRQWNFYVCQSCGGVVTAYSSPPNREVFEYFPKDEPLSDFIPLKPKHFLQQAIDSVHSPSGSIMLCASSVDAMLKEKGLKDGTLNKRIKEAAISHLLTQGMSDWAHQVRLEANDERHADEEAELPTVEDAQKCIEFTKALAEFLFVLPAKVDRGIEESK